MACFYYSIFIFNIMNNTIIAAVVVSLLVGSGVGYSIARYQTPSSVAHPGASDPAPTVAVSGEHTMNSSMASMLDDLKKRSGEERDVAFLEGMIVHHQGAIEMAKVVSQSTKRPELKQMAENIISAQTTEITTMQEWLKVWFGR